MSLGRLALILVINFLILKGPYICLNFFTTIRNSWEGDSDDLFKMPQDADTLVTWLMSFHALISPILIFSSCNDISAKFVNLFFCRMSSTDIIGLGNNNVAKNSDVLTLMATSEGLQLRIPQRFSIINQPNSGTLLPLPLPPVENSAPITFNHHQFVDNRIQKRTSQRLERIREGTNGMRIPIRPAEQHPSEVDNSTQNFAQIQNYELNNELGSSDEEKSVIINKKQIGQGKAFFVARTLRPHRQRIGDAEVRWRY